MTCNHGYHIPELTNQKTDTNRDNTKEEKSYHRPYKEEEEGDSEEEAVQTIIREAILKCGVTGEWLLEDSGMRLNTPEDICQRECVRALHNVG